MQMLELERAGPLFGNQVPTGSLSCKRGVAGLSGRRAVRPAGGRQSMLWTIAELRPQGPQRAFCRGDTAETERVLAWQSVDVRRQPC